MMAPAFLIKILGCATVGAFVTIGIPIIVVKENEKQVVARQADIDKPTTLSNLFANLASALTGTANSVLKPGEKFSDKAFTKWNPTSADINNIAKNWSGAIENMPNEFFIKLQDQTLTKGEGVCHIKTFQTKINGTTRFLFIPFLKNKLKTTVPAEVGFDATGAGKIQVNGTEFLGDDATNKTSKNKERLQSIIGGSTEPLVTSVWKSKDTEKTQTAQDLLFLQDLYEKTIARLIQLNNVNVSLNNNSKLWEVGGSIKCP